MILILNKNTRTSSSFFINISSIDHAILVDFCACQWMHAVNLPFIITCRAYIINVYTAISGLSITCIVVDAYNKVM